MTGTTIWKYDLAIEDEQRIPMPSGARILSVAVQFGRPVLWALVSPEAELVDRTTLMRGTGHPVGSAWRGAFIGTVLVAADSLVFHVFEAPA